MKRFFKPLNLKKASILLVAASLLSYVAGLARDLILSFYFGTTGLADVYYTAFLVPDLIFALTVAGVLGGVFMPIFKESKQSAVLASSFLLVSQVLVVVISGLAYFLMPMIVETFFHQATDWQQVEIIQLSRVLLLSPVVFALSNSLGTILMSFKHYLSYALSPALYNIGIILGIYFFQAKYGIFSAAIGVVIGLICHLAVRFFDLWTVDFKFSRKISLKGVGKIFWLSFPKTLGLVMWQISIWIYNILGYSLVEGSISAYNYARNVQSFAVSLFGIALATAVFPYLVDCVTDKKMDELATTLELSIVRILRWTVPAAVGMALLSTEIMSFLFERGVFDSKSLALTAGVLWFFSFSIPFESLVHLFSRAFYAFKNVWTPVLVNMTFLLLNGVIAFGWAKNFGVEVFAIAFGVGMLVQTIFLAGFLQRYVKLNYRFLGSKIGLILAGSGVMGVVVWQMKSFDNLILSVIVGVVVYFVLLRKILV